MKKIVKPLSILIAAMLACGGAILFVVYWLKTPDPVPLRIEEDTTYLTSPLKPDGTVDYAAALNARLGAGKSPDQNAAALLARIWPAEEFAPAHRQALCEGLGIEIDELGSIPFVALETFVEANADPEDMKPTPPQEPEELPYGVRLSPELQEMMDTLASTPGEPLAITRANDALGQAVKRPWTEDEFPMLAGWLSANEEALNLAIRAVQRSDYYVPIVVASPDELLIQALQPQLGFYRELALALACRAMLRAGEDDLDAAWQDILTTWRLGRLQTRGAFVITYLVGNSTEAMAIDAAIALATRPELEATRAAAMLADVGRLPRRRSLAAVLTLGERLSALDGALGVIRDATNSRVESGDPFTAPPDIDVNLVLAELNRYYNLNETALSAGSFKDRFAALEAVGASLEREIEAANAGPSLLLMTPTQRRVVASKAYANLLMAILYPAFGASLSTVEATSVRSDLSRVAFVLAIYRDDHGHYPDSLQELTRDGLSPMPGDSFSDQPFQYRREGNGYVLYSVGRDLEDDGGSDDSSEGDLVIRVESTGEDEPES